MGRSPWGSVRKLPSGRFQARYCIDLVWHGAPTTFRTKREADAYLASVRSDVDRGSWIDPDAGKVTFGEYASRWLAERPQLRPRTRELYEGELRLHILPAPRRCRTSRDHTEPHPHVARRHDLCRQARRVDRRQVLSTGEIGRAHV